MRFHVLYRIKREADAYFLLSKKIYRTAIIYIKFVKEDRGNELWNAEEGDTEDDKKRKLSKKQEAVSRKNSKTRVRVECGLQRVCRYEQIVRLGMN